MQLLGLLSALSLALGEANVDDPEPTESTTTSAPAAARPPADAPPKRPEPRYKGTGLLATTGVLGGAALAMTITRIALLKKNCPLEGAGAAKCSYDFGSDIGLAATQWSLNVATIGFAAGAGVMLGRYHAWKDAIDGRQRKIKAITATGGALVGVGIAGIGASIALAFVMPKHCLDVERSSGDPLSGDRCLMKAYPAWTMTNWASFAMVSSGTAMLAYGTQHRRASERLSRLQFSPFAGRTYAGFGVAGRF